MSHWPDPTDFPTCPQCQQQRIEEWEIDFDARGRALYHCENCGAVCFALHQSDGRYLNALVTPGTK